ncbi:MAG TPA: HYR domain-containing protein, partial [Gillisia sp.]|nr:HYR domain-containing protein [Gillisia sp.]
PTGLAFDKDDNLYVADHYIGDANPSRPSSIKIFRKDNSGNYKNNLIKEFDNIQGTLLNFPYRLAVNSQGHLYMSELGQDGTPQVKILELDAGFNPKLIDVISGAPSQIGSPGSIIIDKFDNIFIADLGELDLPRLLAATNNVNEFYDIFEIIKSGIKNNLFNINVYNPNNSFNNKISAQIDFPVDLSISPCGTLYVNNAIFDGTIISTIFGRIPDITIDFDLEAYQRSPGYDTEKPVVTCPADILKDADLGKNYSVVSYANPTFSDNCSTPTLTQTGLVSGSQFPIGINDITFTATDSAGNTTTCSFTITIIPGEEVNMPPVFVNCPANINENNDAGSCGAKVTFQTPLATDDNNNVTVTRIDNGPQSGDLFPVGITTINFEANDGVNAPVSCSFTITVIDNENPTITCPSNITETIAIGQTGKIVSYTLPVFNDNCSGPSILQTAGFASGSNFPLGTTTNTFVVTDASGNTAECSFTITVIEEPKPSFSCPALTAIPDLFFDANCEFVE